MDGTLRQGERRPAIVKIARFPEGIKDVDQLLRERGDAAYERMIAEAVPAPAWAIDYACNMIGVQTPEQAQEVADALVEYMALLAPVRRARYVEVLAGKLSVPTVAIRRTLNEAWSARRIEPNSQDEPEPPTELGFDLPEIGTL